MKKGTSVRVAPYHRTILRVVAGAWLLFPLTTAQAAKPGSDLDVQGAAIINMGLVDVKDGNDTLTNATYRSMAVSIGQLCGVVPETGEIIVNPNNLLPLVSQNLDVTGAAYFYTNTFTAGNMYVYGTIYGSGAGITNLPVQNITGLFTTRPEIQAVLEKTDSNITGLQKTIDETETNMVGLRDAIAALEIAVTNTNNPHEITCSKIGALPASGGTMTGPITLTGGARITNVPAPANDRDAVSKEYLERRLAYILPLGDISMGIYTNSP